MDQVRSFNPARFGPGRHTTSLLAGRLASGAELRIPLSLVVGQQPGPRVVVTAGVHGDEYEGVRALVELRHELDPALLAGSVVLVPVANPPAFDAGTRTSPLDGINLNRVFPGDPHGAPSERLASTLFQEVIAGADALIDLHSGGTHYLFHPQAGFYPLEGELGGQSRALANAFGVDLLWELPARAGVCSYEAMRAGIPAIGCEIGGNGRCEPEHVALARLGVQNVLAHLGLLHDAALVERRARRIAWRGDFALSPAGGLFRSAVSLNQEVRAGALLYSILGLDGEVRHERYAEHDGLVSALRIFGAIQPGEWDIALLSAAD